MSELDQLPESVVLAIAMFDLVYTPDNQTRVACDDWQTIRAELMRLAGRVAELEAENAELREEVQLLDDVRDSDLHEASYGSDGDD